MSQQNTPFASRPLQYSRIICPFLPSLHLAGALYPLLENGVGPIDNADVEVLVSGKTQHSGAVLLASGKKPCANAFLRKTLVVLFSDLSGFGFALAEISINLCAVVEVVIDDRVNVPPVRGWGNSLQSLQPTPPG